MGHVKCLMIIRYDYENVLSRGRSRIFSDFCSNLLVLVPRPSHLLDTPTIWANAVTMFVHSRFIFISIPSNFLLY